MFIIIGGDGREYGPATEEQIRAWIAAGRANLETKAKAVGSDEWRALGDYAEFGHPTEPPLVATPAVNEEELAPRELRLFARIIDWAIRFLCTLPGVIIIGATGMQSILTAMQSGSFNYSDITDPHIILGAEVLVVSMGALLLTQIILLSIRGQSIGKLILGVRVVRLSGQKAGFVHAWLLREFVPDLLGFVPVVGPLLLSPMFSLVDWCFIFRADRRCVHDFIATTHVVRA